MRSFRVLFAPEAQDDLDALFAYIADRSGRSPARSFTGSLTDYCLGLGIAPERGTRRDDLAPGLRLLGYRRRATIAFVVTADEVIVLRILYRGRDVKALLAPGDDDSPN
ncbi:type II toxin-antitoxin system RelE/ParE family toxin [Bosea caraganae]|uniref:Type II toxin-antitoxin system RelE/ParE family toxin n=1 Tax=Bosea caraganae TaxID=2763117 RepID=A0A370L8V3_9HYPH|nr:type II toxin-antitoxin system RelE/ParE family toxin [Bosea caraganae]RDJ26707.1 type II toxin-antitoxin system RelE/ParE family toxin [Bosea caraganae]RDJ30594.1 type II toxin-antitoxin system RelE/ParE family toxin [Bosea caraganae]